MKFSNRNEAAVEKPWKNKRNRGKVKTNKRRKKLSARLTLQWLFLVVVSVMHLLRYLSSSWRFLQLLATAEEAVSVSVSNPVPKKNSRFVYYRQGNNSKKHISTFSAFTRFQFCILISNRNASFKLTCFLMVLYKYTAFIIHDNNSTAKNN